MQKRRGLGQASIEYIMTYGWVLIVMSVVLIALWQYGIFKPPATPPGCSGFSQIRPLDHKASGDGKVQLTMINDAGMKLTLDQINASIYGVACSPLVPAVSLRAGDVYVANLTACPVPARGEYYKVDISVAYTNPTSGINHNSVGECHGEAE